MMEEWYNQSNNSGLPLEKNGGLNRDKKLINLFVADTMLLLFIKIYIRGIKHTFYVLNHSKTF